MHGEALFDWAGTIATALTAIDETGSWLAIRPGHGGDWVVYLDRSDGLRLICASDHYDANKTERIKLYPDTVANLFGQRESSDRWPEITVSAKREALAAAKDIQRRLLPQAAAYHFAIVERNARTAENHRVRLGLLEELERVAGRKIFRPAVHQHRSEDYKRSTPWNDSHLMLRVEARYDYVFKLELEYVPLELAAQIVRLIQPRLPAVEEPKTPEGA